MLGQKKIDKSVFGLCTQSVPLQKYKMHAPPNSGPGRLHRGAVPETVGTGGEMGAAEEE